jgi:hypothetical protein
VPNYVLFIIKTYSSSQIGNVSVASHSILDPEMSYNEISSGQDSSVGIATRYVLDGPGIESRWG